MTAPSSTDAPRIKVLLLIPTLDRSGAEKQLTLLATRLDRTEFDVHIAALTRSGPFEAVLRDHGLPVTILHKRYKFDPFNLWKLRRFVRQQQPDVLHTWMFAANTAGRLVAGGRERPKIIVSERCVDTWKSGWQLWCDRRLISRTDRLVGNSRDVAAFYQDLGYPPDATSVIPNGIEVPESIAVHRTDLLAELGLPATAKVVGYIGRLARQKRLDDLVWAAELLRQLNDDAHFVIVGDGPERERLQQLARDVRCESHVHFLGHRDDVARLLGVIDVLWLASDFEGMSNSLMEAMAAGIPTVVSDISPNRELVVDGETGFVVPVGDRAGFAQFTERLLADPQLARRLGNAGRERIGKHFNIEQMVQSYAALYREVVSSS